MFVCLAVASHMIDVCCGCCIILCFNKTACHNHFELHKSCRSSSSCTNAFGGVSTYFNMFSIELLNYEFVPRCSKLRVWRRDFQSTPSTENCDGTETAFAGHCGPFIWRPMKKSSTGLVFSSAEVWRISVERFQKRPLSRSKDLRSIYCCLNKKGVHKIQHLI